MIVRLFKKGDENVLGTINTSGLTANATGVGETLLEAWMEAKKETSTPDATRQLETFFAEWNNAAKYSQADDRPQIPVETEEDS